MLLAIINMIHHTIHWISLNTLFIIFNAKPTNTILFVSGNTNTAHDLLVLEHPSRKLLWNAICSCGKLPAENYVNRSHASLQSQTFISVSGAAVTFPAYAAGFNISWFCESANINLSTEFISSQWFSLMVFPVESELIAQ